MSEQTPRKCSGHRAGHEPIDCPNEAKWVAKLPGYYDTAIRMERPEERYELCGTCVRGYRKSSYWSVTPLS